MARYMFRELVVDSRTGLNPRKNFTLGTGSNYYITIKDIHDGKIIITDKTDRVSDDAIAIIKRRSRIKNGDVLFTSIGRIGETAIVTNKDDTWDVNESVFVFTLNTSLITQDFFCILFQSKNVQEKLARDSSGSTFKSIKMNQLEKMSFDIPDIEEQKQTAGIMRKINKLIALRKEQLAALDQLVKSRFIELFDIYTETVKLSDVATVSGGLTKNAKRDKLPLRMPYLRVANVSFASIDVSEMLDIGLTEEEYEKTLLRDGDLLFVEGNGSPDQIGRVAIWRNEIVPCVHQNHLIKARFNKGQVVPNFAMHYFMTPKGREQIKGKAVSTSGLYTLSVSKISDLMMPIPPMELQNQFAAFVKQTDKSKLAIQHSLDELETLKKALMQKYFE